MVVKMDKKQKQIKKAYISDVGFEGLLLHKLQQVNMIAEKRKQLKELKKDKKFKHKTKELKNK